MAGLSRRRRRTIVYGTLIALAVTTIWTAGFRSSTKEAPATAEQIPAMGISAGAGPEDVVTPEPEPAVTEALPAPAASPPAAQAEPSPDPKRAEPVPAVRTYLVVAGDTIEAIALRFGLKTSSILWSNRIEDETLLQIGQELLIPAVDGLIHTVAEGDTLWEVATLHGGDVDQVIRANNTSPELLQPGQHLLIPGGRPRPRPIQVASRSGAGERRPATADTAQAPSSGGWLWPLRGVLTDGFGWRIHPVTGARNFHEGIDIGVPEGTPIAASRSGKVTLAEWYGGYGLTVRVDHGGGLVSRYSHNSALLVKVGETVRAGQIIARSGNTGTSTGPHLDFGIYRSGVPFDPLTVLP